MLPSCLHSIAEAVNCKELKHIGHHLRHPSFQKLPLFTPLTREAQSCRCFLRCHFGGDTWGRGGDLGEEHKQYLKGMHGFLGSSAIERII